MILHEFAPIWLLIASAYGKPLQAYDDDDDSSNFDVMSTEKNIDIDAHDPDCFKRGICRWDMRLYQKMSGLPFIGPVWKEYLSEERKKKTYLILCLLSAVLVALFAYSRRKSIVKSSTDSSQEKDGEKIEQTSSMN